MQEGPTDERRRAPLQERISAPTTRLSPKLLINGKVEALNGTVQKELINRVEFADRDDAARQLGAWVRHYNFQRTHQALGGLLVPADRFFGCEEESLRRIEEGHGGSPLDLMAPESRVLELFKVVSEAGKPAVYLMGKKLLGS